jgi:hypothetical protein
MRGDKENVQRQLLYSTQAPSAAVIRKLKSTALQQSIFIISCTAGAFIYLKVIFFHFTKREGGIGGQGRGHSIYFRLWKFTPEFVQRHSLKFNTLPRVNTNICTVNNYTVCWREGGCWVVLETIQFTTGLLHSIWDQIQCLQNCLTSPDKSLGGEGGLRKMNSCRKVLSQVTFKTDKFCIAFFESYFPAIINISFRDNYYTRLLVC